MPTRSHESPAAKITRLFKSAWDARDTDQDYALNFLPKSDKGDGKTPHRDSFLGIALIMFRIAAETEGTIPIDQTNNSPSLTLKCFEAWLKICNKAGNSYEEYLGLDEPEIIKNYTLISKADYITKLRNHPGLPFYLNNLNHLNDGETKSEISSDLSTLTQEQIFAIPIAELELAWNNELIRIASERGSGSTLTPE